MGNTFMLEVVTPDHEFFKGETTMTIFRTTEGDMAVLYDHEHMVAPLRIGSFRVKDENGEFKWAASTAGFVTVGEHGVKIIVDSAEWVDEIDLERAVEAKERAEKRIRNEHYDDDIDFIRARAALERAINRIRLREMFK